MVGDPFVTASARVIDLAFLAAVEAAGNPLDIVRRPRECDAIWRIPDLTCTVPIKMEALPDMARSVMELMVADLVWRGVAVVDRPVTGLREDMVLLVRVDGFF